MKRCPECWRDYYDDTLSFCLSDGSELVYGLSADEPATAILDISTLPGEAATRAQIHTTDKTAILPTGADAEPLQSAKPGKASAGRFKIRTIIGATLLLVIVGIGFAVYKFGRQSKPPISTAQMKLTRLTTSGNATVAAISPDGKYVVHAIDDNGQQSLWMRQTVTQSNVQIVPPAAVNYSRLIFSPDGDYLLYTAAAERNVDDATLYQIDVLGGTPRKLLSNVSSFMALSPDASQIVFKREFPAEGIDTR